MSEYSASRESRAPLRVALLGCGTIARQHARQLAADDRCQVVVCCDPRLAAAREICVELLPGAAATADWERALSAEELDAAVICSPTPAHFGQAMQALGRGLHVLCEKPLAGSRQEILDLIAASRAAGRTLAMAYQRRYKAPYITARRELRERADWYGPLKQIHVFVCERWQQTIAGTWRDDPAMGAGYFGDAGSHQADICHFIGGAAPLRLFAHSQRRGSQVQIVTQVIAELAGGAGLNAHFVGDANHWREDIHFHCARGDLLLRSEEIWRTKDNTLERVTDLAPASSPVQGFLDAVLEGQPPAATAEAALPLFDWTAAVLRSAQSGVWEDVGPASAP